MITWIVVDWLILIGLAVCVFVWPTQLISDRQNRWLRITVISVCAVQVIVDGPRMQLLPAYLVAALFSILLIPRRGMEEPSAIRESKESRGKKLVRWGMVAGSGVLVLAATILCVLYPRVS